MGGRPLSAPQVALVVNPTAGTGRAGRAASAIAARLRAVLPVDVVVPSDASAARRELARCAGEYGAVVVLGGDGMVHLALQALAGGDVPLGVVPVGTGNDVAATLGFSADPLRAADEVAAAIVASRTRRIDLGRTDSGTWWATVLCSGFDSAVNERANALRWPAGPRRYDLAIMMELARHAARRFRLSIDGATEEFDATLVAVGNGPQYGGGKRITPHARLDDGRLGITVVGPISRTTLARLAPSLPRAGHIGHPAVRTLTGHEVTVSAAGTIAYADGERLGELPVTTRVVPGALTVLSPYPSPR